ncbi:LOW QUALITY PROTEIN: hypothetical protein PanWU01x14_009080 [Parasponia andersonii]|uniref:Uncharacterized protein n=1 Tax=Parasponia andersonii TaxID=3476 RepID=A0A2P5E2A5_PARAD|nr:LOW QUALITY PROTEIN: hypothetical protein PanWU01x14_009080 [Parasponia andersonii]
MINQVKRHVKLSSNDNQWDASKVKHFSLQPNKYQAQKRKEKKKERERQSPTHQRLQSHDRRRQQLRRRQAGTQPNLAFSAVDSKPKTPKNYLQKKKPPR